ncbi:metallophosphoesterase family protein [Luteolibacter luteus]|uniref:Alkaline phosphatase n=1 Tax=Luteolibacter luteus TaxID=2728835 RepID=A0A858RD37_9BACT|nr:metallophosphoesterase [Luteolibacter luteus]QJE94956.1 alkaline phosphatase [Luteolibacter luteus]
MKTRRRFIQSLAATATFPLPVIAADGSNKKLRIGLIADIHKDLVPDADERLKAFIDAMNLEKVDAVIQLGDFCQPKPKNQGFLEIFHGFPGPKYHVLGNHDMDGGFKREETVAYYGMENRYYSFDMGGCHFVVLDANDKPEGWKSGYPHFIAKDQVDWLAADLAATKLNTFIFSHQSLERPACIDNQEDVRRVIEEARTPDGKAKVAGCFNGHWHIDHCRRINGIPYVHINSASYFWMGGQYRHDRLDPELAKQFPALASSGPYVKPLFTVLEIDPAQGSFTIRAMKSEWQKPSPQDLNYQSTDIEADFIRAEIRGVDSKAI